MATNEELLTARIYAASNRQHKKDVAPGSKDWLYWEQRAQEQEIRVGIIADYSPDVEQYMAKEFGRKPLTQAQKQAEIDRQMGQSMFGMLAPSGVSLETGFELARGETRITDNSQIVLSGEASWYDNVVGVERAKHAPTIGVVYEHLGQEMGEVWKAIEESSAAYRQAEWTHNPELLEDVKENLSKRPVDDLNKALTNAAFGLPTPILSDADRVAADMAAKSGDTASKLAADRQDWIATHGGEIEAAVKMAGNDLEELFNVAYWIGCELDMVDDQVDAPDTTGDGAETSQEGEGDEENDSDSTGSDSGESGDDSDDDSDAGDSPEDEQGEDSEESDEGSGDGESGDSESDGSGDDQEDSEQSKSQGDSRGSEEESGDESGSEDNSNGEGSGQESGSDSESSEQSQGGSGSSQEGGTGSSGDQRSSGAGLGSGSDRPEVQKVLDAMENSIEDNEEAKPNASDSFGVVHPHERWVVIEEPTMPLTSHTNVSLALEDFVGNDEYKESHFGDPDPDLIHELRLGNMDVFEIEAETQGRVVVVVDCSGSMHCWCDAGKAMYDQQGAKPFNGWLAWQIATAIHKQFPDAEVFGYSSEAFSARNLRGSGRNHHHGHRISEIAPEWSGNVPDMHPDYKSGKGNRTIRGRNLDYFQRSSSGTAIVPVRTPGHRPKCEIHDSGLLGGGTPESGALGYLTHRLDAAFETSVGILITDGQPSQADRSYAMTRKMHKAGMRFGVIAVNYQDTGIYPASMLHHVDSADDLQKLPDIFNFIAGGSQ